MELFKEMLIRVIEESPDIIFCGTAAKEIVELKSYQALQAIELVCKQKTTPASKLKQIKTILTLLT